MMATNWKVPSVKASGWSPRGRFGRGIGRGIQQFGKGTQQWAAQIMAIKQYEEEKEAKRKKEMYERAIKEAENLATQEKERQDLMKWETIQTRLGQTYEETVRHNKAMEGLAGQRIKDEDKIADYRTKIETAISNAYGKIKTPYAQNLLKMAEDAFEKGDYEGVAKASHMADNYFQKGYLTTLETIKTTGKGGEETTTEALREDYNNLKPALREMLYNIERITGTRPQYEGKPSMSPAGRTSLKALMKDAIKNKDPRIAQLRERYGNVMEVDPTTGEPRLLWDILIDELDRETEMPETSTSSTGSSYPVPMGKVFGAR